MSGLVSKYQSFAEENEELKKKYSVERERFISQVQEITDQTHDQQDEIKELRQQIESLKNSHEIVFERLAEKKEYEKDKAVLEAERNYQGKLLEANNEYNEKTRELYNEISIVRKEYEDRIRELDLEVKSLGGKEKINKVKIYINKKEYRKKRWFLLFVQRYPFSTNNI